MPELAAHLERVARELVDAAEHTNKWTFVAPVRRQLIEGVAAALAACAREAKLEEAKWWNDGQHGSHQVSEGSYKCHKCLRIIALERAVGEKAGEAK